MNDITFRPAYLGETTNTAAFAETIGFTQPARISMDNDRFNVLNENGAVVMPASLDLHVIMLWENDTRIYYPPGSYDAARPTVPDCYSDNRVTPSVGASRPQSDLCATCPRAVWDQPTPRGNLVPACDNRYKVACLVGGAGGGIYLLSIAPASRKAYESYRRHLKVNHANPCDVITKLTYQDKQFSFAFSGWVSEKQAHFIKSKLSSDEAAMIVGALDKPKTAPALPAPSPQRKLEDARAQFEASNPTVSLPEKSELAPIPPVPEVQEPKRGRGRPPKEVRPNETFVPPGPIGPATFASPATQPTPAPSAPARSNGDDFGVATPAAPPQNIQDALDRVFGPK